MRLCLSDTQVLESVDCGKGGVMVWHRAGAQVAARVARRGGGRMAEKGGQIALLEPARATFAFVAESRI